MGVLNVTPDSFSDGGRYVDPAAAAAHAREMARAGADIVDVGGESTRPGASPVDEAEEIARVVPVIEDLVGTLAIPLSVDTRKAAVARAAVEAGAAIVNDVSGGADPALLHVAAGTGAGLILMHMRGEPATMAGLTEYGNVVADVRSELGARVRAALAAGVPRDRLAVDPGIGFAKNAAQSLRLLREIEAFQELGLPLVVGTSRKSFIGRVLDAGVRDRLIGTAATVAWLAGKGVDVVRVHDVPEMSQVVRVIEAIRGTGGE